MTETDKKLVLRVREGDDRAFEILMKKYYPKILNHIQLKVGDDEELVLDIAHETILEIYKAFKTHFDSDKMTSVSSYIYGITKNMVKAYFRTQSKFKIDRDTEIEYIMSEIEDDGRIKSLKLRSLIADAIYSLKKSHRNILYLRYFKGLTQREISEQTGVPREKVKDILHYSLKKIRKKIQKR